MGLLNNPRQEHFAQLVATGQSPAQAYGAAGYEGKTAHTCGPRLLKRREVRSRVTELQQTAAQTSVRRVALNRERVMNRLSQLSHEAQQKGQFSAAVRCEELIGKQLGMFVQRVWRWSGRLEDLDPEQLDNYMASLKVLIDAEEGRLLEQQNQLEAGPVVDIQATESSGD